MSTIVTLPEEALLLLVVWLPVEVCCWGFVAEEDETDDDCWEPEALEPWVEEDCEGVVELDEPLLS